MVDTTVGLEENLGACVVRVMDVVAGEAERSEAVGLEEN